MAGGLLNRIKNKISRSIPYRTKKALRQRLVRYPLLYDLYYRYFTDFQQGSIKGPYSIPPYAPGERHLLVFSKRYWSLHSALEVLFAREKQRAGWNVSVVGCDRALDTCDHMHYGLQKPNCSFCATGLKKIVQRSGLRYISIRKYLSRHRPPRPRGRDYRSIIYVSWIRLLRSLHPREPEEFQLQSDLERNCIEMDRFLTHYFETNQVDQVLMVNGKFFTEQLLREHCEERGIPYVTYERGAIKDTVMFGHDRAAIPGDTASLWKKFRNQPLSAAQREELTTYLESRKYVGNAEKVSFYEKLEEDRDAFFRDYKLPSGGELGVLFTNTIWDSSTVREDTIFKDMFDWIHSSVEWYRSNPDKFLIIRVHPVEVRVRESLQTRDRVVDFLDREFSSLPENVRVVPPESSISPYMLMDIASKGLVYCSTTGMEMALRNKPVIVASRVHYNDSEMVYIPASRKEFESLLDRRPLAPLPDQVELMERYCYSYYFRHMISYSDLLCEVPGMGFQFKDMDRGALLSSGAAARGTSSEASAI